MVEQRKKSENKREPQGCLAHWLHGIIRYFEQRGEKKRIKELERMYPQTEREQAAQLFPHPGAAITVASVAAYADWQIGKKLKFSHEVVKRPAELSILAAQEVIKRKQEQGSTWRIDTRVKELSADVQALMTQDIKQVRQLLMAGVDPRDQHLRNLLIHYGKIAVEQDIQFPLHDSRNKFYSADLYNAFNVFAAIEDGIKVDAFQVMKQIQWFQRIHADIKFRRKEKLAKTTEEDDGVKLMSRCLRQSNGFGCTPKMLGEILGESEILYRSPQGKAESHDRKAQLMKNGAVPMELLWLLQPAIEQLHDHSYVTDEELSIAMRRAGRNKLFQLIDVPLRQNRHNFYAPIFTCQVNAVEVFEALEAGWCNLPATFIQDKHNPAFLPLPLPQQMQKHNPELVPMRITQQGMRSLHMEAHANAKRDPVPGRMERVNLLLPLFSPIQTNNPDVAFLDDDVLNCRENMRNLLNGG